MSSNYRLKKDKRYSNDLRTTWAVFITAPGGWRLVGRVMRVPAYYPHGGWGFWQGEWPEGEEASQDFFDGLTAHARRTRKEAIDCLLGRWAAAKGVANE